MVMGLALMAVSLYSLPTTAAGPTTITSTITSTSVIGGTTTVVTTTVGGGGTVTSTTTLGGSTTTVTSTSTATVVPCVNGYYWYNGACHLLPSGGTTTTTVTSTSTTVNNVVTTFTTTATIVTTSTVTVPAVGTSTNCNYNGYPLICAPLTVTAVVLARGGYTTPMVNDPVTVKGTLSCGIGITVGVLQGPTNTDGSGQVTFRVPAYYPTPFNGGVVANSPCTGTLAISEAQNLASTSFTLWPSVNQAQVSYVVYLSAIPISWLDNPFGSGISSGLVTLILGLSALVSGALTMGYGGRLERPSEGEG